MQPGARAQHERPVLRDCRIDWLFQGGNRFHEKELITLVREQKKIKHRLEGAIIKGLPLFSTYSPFYLHLRFIQGSSTVHPQFIERHTRGSQYVTHTRFTVRHTHAAHKSVPFYFFKSHTIHYLCLFFKKSYNDRTNQNK